MLTVLLNPPIWVIVKAKLAVDAVLTVCVAGPSETAKSTTPTATFSVCVTGALKYSLVGVKVPLNPKAYAPGVEETYVQVTVTLPPDGMVALAGHETVTPD